MDSRKRIALVVVGIAALIALVTAVQLVGREARWLDVGTLVTTSFVAGLAARFLVARTGSPKS